MREVKGKASTRRSAMFWARRALQGVVLVMDVKVVEAVTHTVITYGYGS